MNGRVTIRRPITEWLPMEYELDGKGIQIAVPEDVIRTIGKGFRRSGVRERRCEKWSGG